MLARCLPGILPPLELSEAFDVAQVRSLLGDLLPGRPIDWTRPFRAPHHGISMAGLIGGGSGYALPGEISRANHGVLFLDELAEFQANVLQALRQPLETGRVTITRSGGSVTYPALFTLVAALPVRVAGRSFSHLPMHPGADRCLSAPPVRPAPRPHRPPGRRAACAACGACIGAPWGTLRCNQGAGACGKNAPARAPGMPQRPAQAEPLANPRGAGAGVATHSRALVGTEGPHRARFSPRLARRADGCGSGRRRADRGPTRTGSAGISTA